MSPLHARTIVEAYLFVDLTAVAAEQGEDAAGTRDYRAHTKLTEGAGAWRLRFDGRGLGLPLAFEVLVPFETEFQARREHLRFGDGPSELIDAGQWRVVGAGYAGRAMRDDLRYSEEPGDARYQSVVLGWESARDAVAEVAKFLPEDAGEVPATAFWSDVGEAALRDEPELFTRQAVESDIAFFQRRLDHFTARHADRRP
ncbi:hypothetical protein AB0O34_27670 [Sphaerisporangium sp. NPDC088356]|uniref:hypothetical protein n=1 Tax=Sphaerisporangium sp. NPDC088356 TaxID=3154871 RepID=UPI00344701F6